MENKSKVVKSKSSNSTLTKCSPIDKKCRNLSRSNGTFQPYATKKRGVYVERKPTKESFNDTPANATPKDPVKAPKRPSRGQKRFLSTVLSLLSKSSTGTQCPATEELKPILKKQNTIEKVENKVFTAMLEPERRKKKYKSKILNSSNYPPDTFEVHKKSVALTSSIEFTNDEEPEENIKWAEFLPRLVQPDLEEVQMEKDKKLSHLVKEVAEGRSIKEKRVTIETKEPPTLVSQMQKNTTKDPAFYNFFVDLLETTFSVYNVNTEYSNTKIPSAKSSKVAFEMDEAVANKLNVAQEVSRQPSNHVKYKDPPKEELIDCCQTYSPRRTYSLPLKKQRNKSESLPKYKTPKAEPRQPLLFPQSVSMRSPPLFPKTESITQKKPSYRKNSKQLLLNMLKEQLRMDFQQTEDPQTLFQALQVLAKNKRKTQKTLRFEDTPNAKAGCMFRTRRLVPRRLKTKSNSDRMALQQSDYQKWQKKDLLSEDEDSNHSLKVVNMDNGRYGRLRRHRKIIGTGYSPTSHSPASHSPTAYSPTSYSPTSYSPYTTSPNFSPAASLQNIACEANLIPRHPQVIMTVKPINHV